MSTDQQIKALYDAESIVFKARQAGGQFTACYRVHTYIMERIAELRLGGAR